MKLQELIEKRKNLVAEASKATTNEELDRIEVEMRKLNIQIEALEQAQGTGEFNPVNTFRNLGDVSDGNDNEDMYSSLEYRKAFKDYVLKGTPIPEKFILSQEKRGEFTLVTDIAAVIPTNIMNKVIEDMTAEGNIMSRVTETAYQGGVDIPISEVELTASWLSGEAVSNDQKAKMDAKINFSYHILGTRVAIGLLAYTVSLPVFEATVIKQVKKAMIKAIEKAIMSGTGSGEPKGITKYDDLPADQVIEMDSKTVGTIAGWAGVEAAIPEAYENRLIYLMSKNTWSKYIEGMVDTTGQRIGLGKVDEIGKKKLNGREVIVTDNLPAFDKASAGDIFAVACDLEQYCLNSNLAMQFKRYFDEKENKWFFKALMIVDGKMALGKNSSGTYVGAKGLIYVKKKDVA